MGVGGQRQGAAVGGDGPGQGMDPGANAPEVLYAQWTVQESDLWAGWVVPSSNMMQDAGAGHRSGHEAARWRAKWALLGVHAGVQHT